MSQKDVDNLSQKKIQQLLAAVGTASQTVPADDIAVTEYDWRCPRYFTMAQLGELGVFAENIASGCADRLSQLYQDKIDISVLSTEQCILNGPEQSAYYVTFGTESGRPFGVLSIPCVQGRVWIEQALGGGEQTDSEETSLSELEGSLLIDVAEDLLNNVSEIYGQSLQTNRDIIVSESVALDGSEEMYKITFEVKQGSVEGDAGGFELLICCDKLHSIAGKTPPEKTASGNITKILQEHLGYVPINLTVQLGETTLSFADVLDLQVGDIVVLNNEITEPIPVQAGDKTLFYGRLAKSCGQQAVVIA